MAESDPHTGGRTITPPEVLERMGRPEMAAEYRHHTRTMAFCLPVGTGAILAGAHDGLRHEWSNENRATGTGVTLRVVRRGHHLLRMNVDLDVWADREGTHLCATMLSSQVHEYMSLEAERMIGQRPGPGDMTIWREFPALHRVDWNFDRPIDSIHSSIANRVLNPNREYDVNLPGQPASSTGTRMHRATVPSEEAIAAALQRCYATSNLSIGVVVDPSLVDAVYAKLERHGALVIEVEQLVGRMP